MIRILAVIAAGVALSFALTGPAAPEPACEKSEHIRDTLSAKFGERRAFAGVDHRGRLIEIYLNPEKGSWTVVATGPGLPFSCVLGVGTGGAVSPAAPKGQPS